MGVPKPVLTLILAYPDQALQAAHLTRGALFLPEPEPLPEPFAEIVLRVETAAGTGVELEGKVLQILPGRGIAVSFDDVAAARVKLAPLFAEPPHAEEEATFVFWGRIERKASLRPVDPPAAPPAENLAPTPVPEAPAAPEAEPEAETDAAPGSPSSTKPKSSRPRSRA